MIIIEGCDGAGKTTLCKKLLARLPTHVYSHFTRLPEGFDYYWGYADRVSPNVVQDRFHLSELAYSHARGELPKVTEDEYRLVDAALRRVGCVTVLIAADAGLVRSRWDESQMYDLKTTLRAATGYEVLAGDVTNFYRDRDIDFIFHCDKDNPYVTDAQVDAVLTGYALRRETVARVARRRPPSV